MGSEMCIRDRPRPCRTFRGGPLEGGLFPALLASPWHPGTWPVNAGPSIGPITRAMLRQRRFQVPDRLQNACASSQTRTRKRQCPPPPPPTCSINVWLAAFKPTTVTSAPCLASFGVDAGDEREGDGLGNQGQGDDLAGQQTITNLAEPLLVQGVGRLRGKTPSARGRGRMALQWKDTGS